MTTETESFRTRGTRARSTSYSSMNRRTSKSIRRHRAAVFTALLLLLALISGCQLDNGDGSGGNGNDGAGGGAGVSENGGGGSGGGASGAAANLADCPTLSLGDRDPTEGKNCVRALQQALRDHGYEQPITGVLLEKTRSNVVDFQQNHGIEPDGVVGPTTRTKLLTETVPPVEPPTFGPASLSNTCSGSAGQSCPILGSGFKPGELINLYYTWPLETQGELQGAHPQADENGKFNYGGTLHALGSPGEVAVTAVGQESDLSAITTYYQKAN